MLLPEPSFPVYDRPATIVETQIEVMNQRANSSIAVANATIAALATLPIPGDTAPPEPRPGIVSAPNVSAEFGELSQFGEINPIDDPTFEDFSQLVDATLDDAIPTFVQPLQINPVARPAPIDTSGKPTRPTIVQPTMPAEPDLPEPVVPTLLDISIPIRPTIIMPTFSATVPTFDDVPPSTPLDWDEPTYVPLVQNELAATIKLMLEGGYAMPDVVERAIFDKSAEREDVNARQAIDAAFSDFADRGFSMPPGMLAEQVNAAREKALLAKNTHSRDVHTKAAEWANANLREALAQGIALEGVVTQRFMEEARRIFEAAKFRVEVEVTRFNAKVSAHNAKISSINAFIAVFEVQVKAELSKLEQMKLEIEAEALKGQINEQNIRIYVQRGEALKLRVDMFRARIDGVKAQTDIERQKLEGYRADIDAYVAGLDAEKKRFDAYEAELRAEGSKAQIIDSMARAFAATVDGITSKGNLKIAVVNAKLRAIEVGATKYTALLQAERERVNAELAALQGNAAAFAALVDKFRADVQLATSAADVEIRAEEANVRNSLAYFDIRAKQFDNAMVRLLENVRLRKESIQAAGTMASQLAAGAMSAMHVQASLSGSGSASTSSSATYVESHNYDEE